MATFDEDHIWGKQQEELRFRDLKRYFGHTLQHNDDLQAPWDFEDGTTAVEMKSRKNASWDFSETMIKTLKVERAQSEGRDCFFVFNFLDGLYCIQYDERRFANYKTKTMRIKDRADYKERDENRTFIPVRDLTLIKLYPLHRQLL
jgi:hypothetical protein